MGENATGFGILDGVRDLVGVCADSPGDHDLATWMRLVAEVSDAMTVLAAARDEAIVRLAAIDEHVDEDGVVSEKVNGLGTVSLDAGSIVAVATNTTVNFAEELVHQAITRVIRVPVVHEAMATGTLDDYKARCIATELTDVPIDLARAVVDVLEEDMGAKTGPALRRRTQAILYRLSPDLLRERLQEARKDLGLQRWAGEPGTERWSGSFPSEDAARAWAAIDALARTLKKDGVCDTLKKARGKALMQIIEGRTDVKTILQLTVPAPAIEDAGSLPAAAGTTVPADGASSHRHGRDDTRSTAPPGPPSTGPAGPRSPDPVDTAPPARPGTPLSAGPRTPPRRSSGPSPEALSATAISRVPQQASRAVVASDESTSVEATSGEATPVHSAFLEFPSAEGTSGEATEVFVAASGPIASELSWLPRSAVTPTTTTEAHSPNSGTRDDVSNDAESIDPASIDPASIDPASIDPASIDPASIDAVSTDPASMNPYSSAPSRRPSSTRAVLVSVAGTQVVHPETGALLDPAGELTTGAYRPGLSLIRFIRQRDGRCRFPGCSTPARSCDIDHVVPWPRGQTGATNLMCLCRRHHRIKQRHRWRVRLLLDGRVQWTDPSGTEQTTYPVDHYGARERRRVRLPLVDLPRVRTGLSSSAALAPGHGGTDPVRHLELTRKEASVTETYYRILVEHAIPWETDRPKRLGPRGCTIDHVFTPPRPEGLGPPPRFVLSRRLRRQYRRRARLLRRQCPDQQTLRTGQRGRLGPGGSVPDYGEPTF